MQIKKDEVRNRILASALNVFQDKGFENASLRGIVKEAGTTLGNFYNYFESKERLYDVLVADSYHGFRHFLEHHEDGGHEAHADELSIDVIAAGIEALEVQVRLLMPFLTPEFLLLIEGSKGTKYTGFKEEVAQFFANHYLDHLQRNGQSDPYAYRDIAGHMFVDGLVALVKSMKYSDRLIQGIMQHFVFFSYGTMGIMSLNKGGDRSDKSNGFGFHL